MAEKAGSLGTLETLDPASVTGDDVSVAAVQDALAVDDPLTRQHACAVCLHLAADSPDDAVQYVDVLLEAFEDESVVVVQRAAAALVTIAEAHPEVFEGAGKIVIDLYDHDISTVRVYAAKLLAQIAVDHPAFLEPTIESLVEALAAEDSIEPVSADTSVEEATMDAIRRQDAEEQKRAQLARETAANVVVSIAEHRPASLVPTVEQLTTLLHEDATPVVAAVVDALGVVAEAHPDAVQESIPDLVDLLGHDDAVVRARAVRALGFAGAEDQTEAVRRIAENDPDEDLRELAAETVDWLDAA